MCFKSFHESDILRELFTTMSNHLFNKNIEFVPDVDHGQGEKGKECDNDEEGLPEHRHLGELELQLKVLDVLVSQLPHVSQGDHGASLGVQVGVVKAVGAPLDRERSVQLADL